MSCTVRTLRSVAYCAQSVQTTSRDPEFQLIGAYLNKPGRVRKGSEEGEQPSPVVARLAT